MFPVFEGETADDLWRLSCQHIQRKEYEMTEGRGGRTKEMLHTVLHLRDPRQRWMYSRTPALNPAFALAEVVWILAGRQDSTFLNYWNPGLPKFAGDGPNYHGAYGWRLKNENGVDQLQRAYEVLSAAPESRQVVLQIWNPSLDLPSKDGAPVAADIPCNICSLLKVRKGRLYWTQIMRSNDLVLGLPHNIVQWTFLQEIMAGWLKLQVGLYTHFSDSLHVYEDHWGEIENVASNDSGSESNSLNTDRLALGYPEFCSLLPQVHDRAQGMISPSLTAQDLNDLARFPDCPEGYQNILLILGAESARRRGWLALAAALAEGCSNAGLSLLWERWLDRQNLKLGKNRISL